MQKLFFLCVFVILSLMVNAQDKIITIAQDTIECRIVSIGAEQISYEQKSPYGYMIGKSIPIEQVATYFRLPQSSSTVFSQRPERPWLLRINPGGSWMPWLFKDIEEASDDGKKLAKGFHLNASGYYLVSQFIGVGIQYSFFRSSAKGEYPIMMDSYYPIYVMLSEKEKQYINYVGPSFIFQQFLSKSKKFQLSETLSGGVMFYRDEDQASAMIPDLSGYYNTMDPDILGYITSSNNSLITGRTFGATLGFSAEYYISPSFSIGLGGDFLFGILKKVNMEQRDSNGNNIILKSTELEKSMKISRIDYSLALSIHF